jgi:hypothetical protein
VRPICQPPPKGTHRGHRVESIPCAERRRSISGMMTSSSSARNTQHIPTSGAILRHLSSLTPRNIPASRSTSTIRPPLARASTWASLPSMIEYTHGRGPATTASSTHGVDHTIRSTRQSTFSKDRRSVGSFTRWLAKNAANRRQRFWAESFILMPDSRWGANPYRGYNAFVHLMVEG